MDNVKDDKYYLDKIIRDLSFVIEHTANKSKSEIASDLVLLDSIMFRLIQIAENTGKLSEQFKDKNHAINWRAIKGMRNRIVHDYGTIDIDIIYETVSESIPALYDALLNI